MVAKYVLLTLMALPMLNIAVRADDSIIEQSVEADACDDRQSSDDKQTALNRAIDKACFSAIKLSGIIQKQDEKMYTSVLDVISYHIIDNNLFDVEHEITFDDEKRVCVKIKGNIKIAKDDLISLINEHKKNITPESLAEISENIKQNTAFKPDNLSEKKLLYINDMVFWNNSETNHYAKELKNLLDNNEYFFITDKKETADFVITPMLKKAQVDKIDNSQHKMQMILDMEITSDKIPEFETLTDEQNHFILFSADDDEQKIADELIKKLLKKSAFGTSEKIKETIQNQLIKENVRK